MTTNAATDTTNVIPMVRANATQTVAPEKAATHVFSGENGENEQLRGNSGAISEEYDTLLVNDFTLMMEKADREQAASNKVCKALIKTILCNPAAVRATRTIINDDNGDYMAYAIGMEAMLHFFDVGVSVQVTQLRDKSAAFDSRLSAKFLYEKIKPLLESNNILVKKDDNSFRWATLEELQELAKTANDLQLEGDDLQMTCNSPAIESRTPANGLRLIGKRLAINPLASVRQWQRERAMQMALADPWKKVTANGTVELVYNPYDLKATGPRTEKEKELIRKAVIVEAEAQLKLKIAAAGDKQRMQEIQRASLEVDAQAQAIINESKLKLAQMQHERMMRRERLATYKTPLIAAGLAAAVLFVVANNNESGMGNNHSYPVELANIPLPAVGAADAADTEGKGE